MTDITVILMANQDVDIVVQNAVTIAAWLRIGLGNIGYRIKDDMVGVAMGSRGLLV